VVLRQVQSLAQGHGASVHEEEIKTMAQNKDAKLLAVVLRRILNFEKDVITRKTRKARARRTKRTNRIADNSAGPDWE